MKRIFFSLMLLVFIITPLSLAFAQYVPPVGPAVCIFKHANGTPCNDVTEYCAQGCPPKKGVSNNGSGGSTYNTGGYNDGTYEETGNLFAKDGPGPFLIVLMVIIIVIATASVNQKKKKQLAQVQLPPAAPPIQGGGPPAAPAPTAPVPPPPPPTFSPTPNQAAAPPPEEKKKRKFRPVYFKKTAQNKERPPNNPKIEKF